MYDDFSYWNDPRPLNSWGDELNRDSILVIMSVQGNGNGLFRMTEWFNDTAKLAGFMRHVLLDILCRLLLGGTPVEPDNTDTDALLALIHSSASGELPEDCELERCSLTDYSILMLVNIFCEQAILSETEEPREMALHRAASGLNGITGVNVLCDIVRGADAIAVFRDSARAEEYDVKHDGEFQIMLNELLCDMGAPELAHEDEDDETTVDFYM